MADVESNSQLQPNNYLSVLQRKEIQEGLLTNASTLLAELGLAVIKTGKKGSVTLTLTVHPEKGNALSVEAIATAKIPSTASQELTIYFVDKESGAFSRDNPEQKELALTAHTGGQAPAAAGVEEETTTEEEVTA